jgi:phenylacetic acid degradation operon negative regulatory protein
MQMLETADGPLPRAAKSFHARFGGIIADEPEPGPLHAT